MPSAIIDNNASIDITNYLNSGSPETIVKANVSLVTIVGGNVIIKSTKSTGAPQTVKLIPSQINSPSTYANANELQAYISSILGVILGGVYSLSFGTTGLTPAAVSVGNIVVAGTLIAVNGGTGLSTYTTGDLIYSSAANTLSKRAIGVAGDILTVSGGLPTWVAASASVVTSFSAGTTGLTPVAATTGAITLAGVLNKANGGTAVNIATAALTLGTASANTGQLVLQTSANAFTTTIQTGVTGASYTLTLPTTDGAASEFLQTDGAGVLTWAAPAGGVTTWSGGTTGLTPAVATAGAITVAGVLVTANGGTGVNIASAALTLGTASSNTGQLVLHTSANAFTTTI